MHSRRRRMALASSARRESTTLSSFARQYGQRTRARYRRPAPPSPPVRASRSGSWREPRDGLARYQRRVAACVDQRVDDRARVGAGSELLGDRPERVAGFDDVGNDPRTRVGSGEGGAPERDARVADRQHRTDDDRRGGEPAPAVHGGGSVASRRRSVQVLTGRAGRAALPGGTRKNGGFEHHDGHLASNIWPRMGLLLGGGRRKRSPR